MNISIYHLKIKISFSFLWLLCLALIVDKSGKIPLCFVASVLHEAGHCVVAGIVFKQMTSMRLSAFGAGLSISENQMFGWKWGIVLISGPAVNVIIGLLCAERYPEFAWINFFVAILNSLPVFPLDGGRLISLGIHKLFSWNTAENLIKLISFLFLFMAYLWFAYGLLSCVFNISYLFLLLYLTMLFANDG